MQLWKKALFIRCLFNAFILLFLFCLFHNNFCNVIQHIVVRCDCNDNAISNPLNHWFCNRLNFDKQTQFFVFLKIKAVCSAWKYIQMEIGLHYFLIENLNGKPKLKLMKRPKRWFLGYLFQFAYTIGNGFNIASVQKFFRAIFESFKIPTNVSGIFDWVVHEMALSNKMQTNISAPFLIQ